MESQSTIMVKNAELEFNTSPSEFVQERALRLAIVADHLRQNFKGVVNDAILYELFILSGDLHVAAHRLRLIEK